MILSLAVLILSLSPLQSEAGYPHHLYMGVWAGGDNTNPSAGGWDNDNTYSVDREMTSWQGRNFAFEETFMNADDVAYLDLITYQQLELIWYYGRVPVVNLNFNSHISCQKSLVQLNTDLDNTSSDAYKGLVNWAKGVKMWFDLRQGGVNNRYLFLAFMYEPNFSFCAVEGDQASWAHVDPVAFKALFRKGRTIVENTVGPGYAGSIRWLFAPANESNNFMPGFETYYPGDDVVDWMGLSAYNFGGYVQQGFTYPWQYFRDFAAPYLDRLRTLAPDKPLALLQTAGISYGGDKNAWIVDFLNDASQYPKLYLVIYFNDVVEGEAGYGPGFDWPVFWNDPYDARPYGYSSVYLPQMRYTGWLTALQNNGLLKFSPIFPMPAPNKFASSNWDIPGQVAPISNLYNLFPELRDKDGDSDGDGVSNRDELAAGLDPLVNDVEPSETSCDDGVDNDANGRIDSDDTVYCGDIPLAEDSPLPDSGRQNENRYFQFNVPGGSSRVTVTVQNITGTVHLYLKKNGRPTPQSYDYEAAQVGAADIVLQISSPAAGLWHVLVHVVTQADYSLVASNLVVAAPRLSDVTGSISCDLDGNGQDDMVFSVNNYGVQSYANNSQWLNLSTDGTNPSLMLCNDIDGDGGKEVVGVWNSQGAMKYFDTVSWAWTVVSTPGSLPDVMRSGDMNADGKDDLVGAFRSAGSLKYRSSASGSWNTISLGGFPVPDDFFVANMDTDSAMELVGVFRGAVQKIKLYNSGVWSDVSQPRTGMPDSVAVGDIDNDGIGDIVAVWRSTPPYSMYVRSGYNGAWREITTASSATPDSKPSRIFIGDVDGDKKDDIISAWDSWSEIQIFRQIWFGWMIMYDQPLPPTILIGDFDGDNAGRKDVAMIWSDRIQVWMNNDAFVDVDVSAPAFAADFTATPVSGAGPLSVSFTDLSNNGPTSWLWIFGDGTSSTERNPRHNYKTAGTFSVTLTATGSGVSPSLTKSSYISVAPCASDPFRVDGVIVDYPSVQSAYGATPHGKSLDIHALDFGAGLNMNEVKSVTLRGGFGCDFSANPDYTVIEGSLVIWAGSVTIEHITLK